VDRNDGWALAGSCYNFMRVFGGYPVTELMRQSAGVQIDPSGVLAVYETKLLDDDAKVESLAIGADDPGEKENNDNSLTETVCRPGFSCVSRI
jgi:hypothetical protein